MMDEILKKIDEEIKGFSILNINTSKHDEALFAGCRMGLSKAKEIIMEQQENNGWIPASEKLPEEKINPITQDYYEYQCTFKNGETTDVRHYKFGNGHWWKGPGIMDVCVIAWQPLPQPYAPIKKDTDRGE